MLRAFLFEFIVVLLCNVVYGQLNLCVDHVTNCEAYGPSICHGTYEEWAHQNCKNYCGYCLSSIAVPSIGPPAPTPGACSDSIQSCSQYGKTSCQGQFMTWARQNCALYCGFCSNTSSVHTGLNLGGCYYKNVTYHAGQTWDDGCAYSCTCLDQSTGMYRCTEKCHTYTHVPQGCSLKKDPGACCYHVVCANSTVLMHTVAQGMVNSTLPAFLTGCTYKGVTHKTGEVWYDGCDFRCTCNDGSIGFYTCRKRCVTWNLPSKCHLEAPQAGKCCAIPKCPAGYQINYPPGYQEN